MNFKPEAKPQSKLERAKNNAMDENSYKVLLDAINKSGEKYKSDIALETDKNKIKIIKENYANKLESFFNRTLKATIYIDNFNDFKEISEKIGLEEIKPVHLPDLEIKDIHHDFLGYRIVVTIDNEGKHHFYPFIATNREEL